MPSFRSSLHHILDFLMPPLCLACERSVTESQTLCASCWHSIHFITPPCCAQCGVPFDFEVEEGTLCGACHENPPSYTSARSVFLYDDASKPLILRFKHADQLHTVPALSKWMIRAGSDLWGQTNMIMPVPLHRWRLLKRRYNQSALLAQAIGDKLGIVVAVDGLIRNRSTVSQGRMSSKQRQKNVAGAFDSNPKWDVEGKVITLIDDVLTSGATIDSCAKLLLSKGAFMVNVVTLARVLP